MLPRILAALLLLTGPLAGPALVQSTGTQGAGGTDASAPDAVPGTNGITSVPGVRRERDGAGAGSGPANLGSATAPGTTRSGGGTGQLVPGRDVTTGGSAAINR